MRLIQLTSSHWKIYAAQTDRGDCPLLQFFEELDKSLAAHRDQMLSLLEDVSEDSRRPDQWLPTKKFHTITNDKKIWQFSNGPLRVACFFDDGKVIVCSHGFTKDSRNTKKSDQGKATKIREKYLLAKQQNTLKIKEESE